MAHPFIPVANVARVELIWAYLGVTMENVFNVQKGSPYTLAQLQALRGTVDGWDAAQWAAIRAVGCQLVRIRTKALDTSSSPTEDYVLPTPRGGADGAANLPGNATYAIKLATGLAGRSFRGRWYVTGICTSALGANANELSAGARTSWVNRLNLLISTLSGAGHTLGVVSYMHDHAWRAAGVFTPAINYTAVDLHMDSMRRRLTNRGI